MTAIATSSGAGVLGDKVQLTDGYSAAFIGAAVVALVGALAAAATLRFRATPAAAADSPTEETREPIAA